MTEKRMRIFWRMCDGSIPEPLSLDGLIICLKSIWPILKIPGTDAFITDLIIEPHLRSTP